MWKMDKKVVFLDVDGTMVNEKGEIPESAQYAVRTAQANGHRMVVCSGRSRFQIYDALLELGFSGIVGGAGAFVEDEGKEFYHAYIDEEHRSCDGMLKVYRDAGMSKERLDRLIGRMHLTEQPWKNEKNEKIIYYGAPFPVAKVHADMEPYFDAVAISLDGMGDFAGEIGINGINKATGMERYLNHVGISRENCIAIGDGPNDLQMMEYAGISVAMGNARDEVKRLADMVTDHIDEDGILHAFERLGLINDCI